MQPLFEYRERFAGTETRVLELEGHGPPLVLFHGFGDSADTWRHVLALLGRLDRAAMAVDLPGFGTADPLSGDPVLPQLDAFGAAVVRRAAKAAGRDAVVVGNSLGGCLALRLAQSPKLPIASVLPVAPAGLDMPAWFALVERDPFVRTIVNSPVPIPGAVVRTLVAQAYRNLAFARPRAVVKEIVEAFTSHYPDRETVRRRLDSARRVVPELRDCFELGRIERPVLVVWGDRDRMVYSSGAQRIVDEAPQARAEIIEDCGHCPQVEAPERLTELLLDFTAADLSQAA